MDSGKMEKLSILEMIKIRADVVEAYDTVITFCLATFSMAYRKTGAFQDLYCQEA